jgi:acyl carrier protein
MIDYTPAPDSDLQVRIEDILRSRMHLTPPGPQSDLFAAGLIDSLTFIDLLLHLEREFEMKFSLDDLELDHFRSIARIARLVQSRRERTIVSPMAAEVLAR